MSNARAQMEQYLSFVKNNVSYLRQKFQELSVERLQGLIIIGLSSNMTNEEKERLKQLNHLFNEYQIITYDELVSRMKNFLENLGVRYGPLDEISLMNLGFHVCFFINH